MDQSSANRDGGVKGLAARERVGPAVWRTAGCMNRVKQSSNDDLSNEREHRLATNLSCVIFWSRDVCQNSGEMPVLYDVLKEV